MTLPNLATASDLSTRGVTISDEELVDTMLTVASAVVRNAAQSPIAQTTSEVVVWATEQGDRWLDLPGRPVTAVEAVFVDGVELAANSYRLANGRLWHRSGYWCETDEPMPVTVVLTHGLASVPPEVVHLVCDLTIAGLNAAGDGARTPGVLVESLDDYSVTFAQGADAVATVMELPASTRRALRNRFGGSAAAVSFL